MGGAWDMTHEIIAALYKMNTSLPYKFVISNNWPGYEFIDGKARYSPFDHFRLKRIEEVDEEYWDYSSNPQGTKVRRINLITIDTIPVGG